MLTLTRQQIKNEILNGNILVIYNKQILKLNSWIYSHPGGQLPILHFVGRDATDEIGAYHDRSVLENLLKKFIIGKVDEGDCEPFLPITPPIQLGWINNRFQGETTSSINISIKDYKAPTVLPPSIHEPIPLSPDDIEPSFPADTSLNPQRQHAISQDFKKLHQKIIDNDLYVIKSDAYLYDCLRYAFLLLLFGICYFHFGWKVFSAIPLGLFWHQITFVVHDAGHCEIWGSQRYDKTLACFIASYIGGLSANWWCDNHDIHHIVTNHPEHDPDIQHIPFFAISTRFFNSLYSTYYNRVMEFDIFAKMLLPIQHKLYYFVMSLARFNLFALSYGFLLKKSQSNFYRNFELLGILVFWTWYGSLIANIDPHIGKFAFLILSNVAASPVHVQIVLSHFARSSEDLGLYECFAHRQLRTTMDVACPPYLDFLHGGLNMQVTHHLFPRIPRHNLRRARDFVAEFAKDNDLEYVEHGFIKGNGQVLDVLRNVGEQVKFVSKVAASEAQKKTC